MSIGFRRDVQSTGQLKVVLGVAGWHLELLVFNGLGR